MSNSQINLEYRYNHYVTQLGFVAIELRKGNIHPAGAYMDALQRLLNDISNKYAVSNKNSDRQVELLGLHGATKMLYDIAQPLLSPDSTPSSIPPTNITKKEGYIRPQLIELVEPRFKPVKPVQNGGRYRRV
jgi:hypothetical protein